MASGLSPSLSHDRSTIHPCSQSFQQLCLSMGQTLATGGSGLPSHPCGAPSDHKTKATEASEARAKVFHAEAERLKGKLLPAALDLFNLIGEREEADRKKGSKI